MFKKLFSKKNTLEILMPITGTVMPITEAPDPVFSEKMMGDGFCIAPRDGHVYAPISGQVVSIFPTKHCIGIKGDKGFEWLIHFGMDTVKLNGEGFELKVGEGDTVKAGDLLFVVDIPEIETKIPSLLTPVVITNLENQILVFKDYGDHQCKSLINIELT